MRSWLRALAALLVAGAALGVAASQAEAAPDRAAQQPGGGDRSGQGTGAQQPGGGPGPGGGGGGGGAAADDPPPDADSDTPGPAVGTVNPLSITNPFCEERLERSERRNCAVTGTPEGRYPSSNYGIDVHIDTGLDNIIGNFQALLAQIANAIWQACLFVLNLVLTLLGWAFGLSPFSDRETMAEIDRGLQRFYATFTEPWLIFAMVAIGAWSMWRGLVRREVSASIAGSLLSLALMIAALWILSEPRDTVGKVSEISNDAALSLLAAPQGGASNPSASYAEATADVWSAMTIPGFAALNFSNADWALSAPDPELLATANEHLCKDAAYISQIPAKKWAELAAATGDDEFDCEEVAQLAASLPAPRTNAEIYLRSSPGSESREKLWDEHEGDAPYASYFAIQGDAGAWTRLPLVVLIALGLLGGICLLVWLALRLLVQSAVAFVLILMTPIALFLPAFGERGRAAFALWGGTFAGALIAKLVYAALLSVVLFATTVIASLADDLGAMAAFLVTAGIWWAVFLKRESLISFMSVSGGEPGDGRSGIGSKLFGLYAASQLGRQVVSPLTRRMGAGADGERGGLGGLRDDRAEATGEVASRQLGGGAQRRLDSRLEGARATVDQQAERRSELAGLAERRERAQANYEELRGASGRGESGGEGNEDNVALASARDGIAAVEQREQALRSQIAATEPAEGESLRMIGAASQRESRGASGWTEQERAESRDAIRREVDRPLDDGAHAWRAGISPDAYSALSGPERERVHGDVAKQLRADRAAFGAIPDRPQGLVGRRVAGLRYRRAAHAQPGGSGALALARREASHERRRRRRSVRHRGVSR